MRLPWLLLPPLALIGCTASPADPTPSVDPYVLVLGSAQDGGLPQLGCTCERCVAARVDERARRFVVSILLVDPRSRSRWLFEATPDLGEQVELARGHGGPEPTTPGRPALFDGIFLSHAHIGHYTGLMQLGREAYGTASTPVYGTPRLLSFLQENGPWSLLFTVDHLGARPLAPGESVELGEHLCVTSIAVPHREEFSDTVAFRIEGPNRSLLFLPDTDKWERFDTPVEALVANVDHALVDGTFYSGEELPGREMSEIPHPFLVESIERFAALSEAERAKISFTHLNHSNPAADPGDEAAAAVRAAGFAISRRGDRFEL